MCNHYKFDPNILFSVQQCEQEYCATCPTKIDVPSLERSSYFVHQIHATTLELLLSYFNL